MRESEAIEAAATRLFPGSPPLRTAFAELVTPIVIEAVMDARRAALAENATTIAATEEWAWKALVLSCHRWASDYMDQWDKFKFDTRHGPVFVTISRQDQYPDDFGKVDMAGKVIEDDQRPSDA